MFSALLLALTPIKEGLPIVSIVLIMLETVWYVLFNVFIGTPLIPATLFEATRFHRSPKQENFRSCGRLLLLFISLLTFTNFESNDLSIA